MSFGRGRLLAAFEANPADEGHLPLDDVAILRDPPMGHHAEEDLPGREGLGVADAIKPGETVFKEYMVVVDTGTLPESQTSGDVYIQLMGTKDKTGLLHLKHGFKVGSRTEFSVFARDVGHVDRIRLAADTTDRWFCDRVWLKAPEGIREFPVGTFIGWPNKPEVTALPSMTVSGFSYVSLVAATLATRNQAFFFPVAQDTRSINAVGLDTVYGSGKCSNGSCTRTCVRSHRHLNFL